MKSAEPRKGAVKPSPAVLNILIAHDNEITRMGIRSLIESFPGYRICEETNDLAETVQQVKKLQPHIVLIKLGLLDHHALKTIGQLLDLRPGLKILIFAEEGPTDEVRRAVLNPTVARIALKQGALALVLNPNAEELRLSLNGLRRNKSFVSLNIFEGVSEVKPRTEHLPSVGELTPREREVFRKMAIGKTTKEIAGDLNNSPRTVEVHRANVMRKLGFSTQADLILFALQHGAVELPEPVEAESD